MAPLGLLGDGRGAEAAFPLAGLESQMVPCERVTAFYLAGAGPLEPLRCGAVRLHLGHSNSCSSDDWELPTTTTWACLRRPRASARWPLSRRAGATSRPASGSRAS